MSPAMTVPWWRSISTPERQATSGPSPGRLQLHARRRPGVPLLVEATVAEEEHPEVRYDLVIRDGATPVATIEGLRLRRIERAP